MLARLEAHVRKGEIDELLHGVRRTGRDHEVLRLLLLEHEPHRLDVVAGKAPISLGREIAEAKLILEAELDACDAVADLARHELEASTRALVVEEDSRHGVKAVRLPVVDRD